MPCRPRWWRSSRPRAPEVTSGSTGRQRGSTGWSTTPSPVAPTSTTSPSSRPVCWAAISSGGWRTVPTTPMWVALLPARCPPTPPRSSPRASGCHRCASRPRCVPCCWRTRAPPSNAPGISTPRWAPTHVASPASPPCSRHSAIVPPTDSPRSSTTASAACAPCWPPFPTEPGRSRTGSTQPALPRTSSTPSSSVLRSPSTATPSPSTSPTRTPRRQAT